MGKGKKKHSKNDQVSDDLLDAAALSVKKFRKVTNQIQKLSTGQKIVGGIALLAAGLTYLSKLDLDLGPAQKPSAPSNNNVPRLGPAAQDAPDQEASPGPASKPAVLRKSRKAAKPKHDI